MIRRATPDTVDDAVAALADLDHRDSATIEALTALVSDEYLKRCLTSPQGQPAG